MGYNTEYAMQDDECNVGYVMDSLQWFEPDIKVLIWFQGKKYYVESVDINGSYPELTLGKEF